MIKIAIVEDEIYYQKDIENKLKKYTKEYNISFQIFFFDDGPDLIENYKSNISIIFMDIKLKTMNGIDTAKKVRKYDSNTIIIFITTMANLAIKGYEVNALDFIVKPLYYEQFVLKMQKALKLVEKKKKKKYIFVTISGILKRIDSESIYYIEIKNHNLFFYLEKGFYSMRGSLNEIEKELSTYYFVRCNNSYLINLEHTTSVQNYFVYVGEYKIPISRPRKKEVLRKFSDFVVGV